jgi:hypothetical protein
MAIDKRKITQKYWNNLSVDSRYRALRKVFSNFSDSTNHDYAKLKAKDIDWMWSIIQRHVKQPVSESYYKTCVDNTWMM